MLAGQPTDTDPVQASGVGDDQPVSS